MRQDWRGALRHDQGRFFGLGLINLDIFLHRMNEVFIDVFRRNSLLGYFTQGDNRILVVIALDGDR